ncbi:MAG: HAMP domain-containing protein, partial [Deltaproteobacteria bacterium]|nr:HAMP domain-containing protein [Deltaproteobacteria bacterium]
MGQPKLDTSANYKNAIRLRAISTSYVGVALIVAYLFPVLQLTTSQSKLAMMVVVPVVLLLTLGYLILEAGWSTPVVQFLNSDPAEVSEGLYRDAFASIMASPARHFVVQIIVWMSGGTAAALIVKSVYSTISWFSCVCVVLGSFAAGYICGLLVFARLKDVLSPLRERLAAGIPDPDVRASLISRVPIPQKLLMVVMGLLICMVLFGASLSSVRSSQAIEKFAGRNNAPMLVELQGLVDSGAMPEAALATFAERGSQVGVEIVLVDEALETILGWSMPGQDTSASSLLAGELRIVRESGDATGDSNSFESPNSFAWMQLADGRYLFAVTPAATFAAEQGTLSASFLFFLLFSALIAAWISREFAQILSTGMNEVSERIERVARGDLRDSYVFESEDEFGALGRAVEQMRLSLRNIASSLVDAADGMDRTTRDISSSTEQVAMTTRLQSEGVQQAAGSTATINQHMSSLAESALGLDSGIQNSSSSIFELGAAGDTLRESGSFLSSKVGDLSQAVSVMIPSIRKVEEVSEHLAHKATEAASCATQSAAIMREVDSSATETGLMAKGMMETADKGRARVQQTIQGMRGIHEQTEAAFAAIQDLAERISKIGTILDVIDDVADETSLLALNAAIIAAQAGEQGKSFAVVAAQIKNLAGRVLDSTKEIGEQIETVQLQGVEALHAFEGGSASVERGMQLAEEAGVALEDITQTAQRTGDR